ncbi:hypothetical protein [Microbacterium sp. NPDC057650]|uniref:hypothetical protein n=1 Tax=unclassified Microbacterium TaxID=2609290 RepID=UPI00366A5F60
MNEDEALAVAVARVDERLIAVERDVKEIKASIRPSWPSVVAAFVAAAALIITLISNI